MAMNGVTLGRNTTVSIFDPNISFTISPNEFAGGKIMTQVDKAELLTFGEPIGIYVPRGYIISLNFFRKNDSTSQYWAALQSLYYGRVNINSGTINVTFKDANGIQTYIFTGAICRDFDIGEFNAGSEVTGSLEFFAAKMERL